MDFSKKRSSSLLAVYLKPLWRSALLLAILLLSSIGLQLLNPQILRYFIDTTIAGGSLLSLAFAGLCFVGIALINQGISVAVAYLSTKIAWSATNRLRSDIVVHCLSLDMSFHKNHTPGEMIERIDGDVDNLSNFFSQFALSISVNVLLLLGVLVLFFFISWIVGVAMVVFSLLVLLILMYMRRRVAALWKMDRQMSATFYGFLEERLSGTEDIRSLGAINYIMYRFYLLMRKWFVIRKKAVINGNVMFIFTLFMFICGSALVLSLGVYLWSMKMITIGTIYVMFSYTDIISLPLQQIQAQLQDLQQAEASIRRVEELLTTSSRLPEDGVMTLPQGVPLLVAFRNVTFGYAPDQVVIHNLSFCIQPGKVLGILGRTGSGKTTLAHLLFRLYAPWSGEICINDINLKKIQQQSLYQCLGIVTQNVQLFHSTVRNNITFFNTSIPDVQILSALNTVGLTSWYHSLPQGLDTVLGTAGDGLSAGEAQLLAFCRILLVNPDIVIFDEASSRLDPVTELLVERAIEKLLVKRTAIVIAHRLATVSHVDDILIIEEGHILEYGRREDLLADTNSHFNMLLHKGLEEVIR